MKNIRHTEEEMKVLYSNWQKSGLNKKAYCQQIGLPHATFFYWVKKLSAKESNPVADFIELDLVPGLADAGSVFLELEYPSGIRLKVYRQTEASWIKSLL